MHLLSPEPTDPTPDAPARSCEQCGAAMLAEQDWCLECGTAAPGRLGNRPGWKAAAAVVGVTLALSGGAVAAAYAAISSDSNTDANAPSMGAGTPVAQAPPAVANPAPATPAGPTGTTASTGASGLVAPTGTSGPSGTTSSTSAPIVPVKPAKTIPTTTPTVTPPPTTAPPVTATPPATTPPATTSTTTTTKPPAKPALTEIALAKDSASLYNPFLTKVDSTDPSDPKLAVDGNADTTWYVATSVAQAGSADGMRVGLVIDLGQKQSVKQVEYTTATPGHTVEVYGTTHTTTPPDILDARWDLLAKRANVDEDDKGKNKAGDGDEIIRLKAGSYRKIVLWFTKPSTQGPEVGITDVTVSG